MQQSSGRTFTGFNTIAIIAYIIMYFIVFFSPDNHFVVYCMCLGGHMLLQIVLLSRDDEIIHYNLIGV